MAGGGRGVAATAPGRLDGREGTVSYRRTVNSPWLRTRGWK